jgi:hypothetical protein
MMNAIALRADRAVLVLLALPLVACASGVPTTPASALHTASAPAAGPTAGPAPFDRIGAAETLDELQEDASRCGTKGSPAGLGRATIVFEPGTGQAHVTDEEAPFAGSPVAPCLERVYAAAHVPPFRGAPVTVRVGFFVSPPDEPAAFSVRTAKLGVRNAIVQCNLALRGPRDVADEVDVHFARSGSIDTIEFYRFEDHQKLDSRATRCLTKALGSAKVGAFGSDEERAKVKVFFTDAS